jgi:MFS transporter, DHA3 family, macrolide efflux protein
VSDRGTGDAVAPAPIVSPAPSYSRALHSRPFLLLWVSQFVSQSGDFVFDVALIWLVLETTGSIFAVGVVVTAALLPTVVLSPILGVYVDRWPRRTILIVTNLAEGLLVLLLAGLVLGHTVNLALIVAIVLALGAGGQIVRLTTGAMVPQTVGKEDLGVANGLTQLSGSTTQVVGLSVGGIVVALLGVDLPITYDAVTFFAAAAIVALMAAAVGRPAPTAGAPPSFRQEFLEGVRYVRGQRYLLEIISVGVVINFCGNAIAALWGPYAKYVLHGGASTYGFLGAAIAVGAIVGALVVGKLDIRARIGTISLAGVVVTGVAIGLLGVTRSIPLALAESFAIGAMLSVINVPLLAAVQARVPPRLMGRAMAALLAFVLAAAPVGAFFAGAMAEATSIQLVFVVLGVVMVATSAVGAAFLGDLRRLSY